MEILTKIVSHLLIRLIIIYQKVISPYKGYLCAHSVLHGDESCSNAVIKIIQSSNSISKNWILIEQRFKACSRAAQILKNSHRADLDCGLSGCFDVEGIDGCFGGRSGSSVPVENSSTRAGCSIPLLEIIFLFWNKNWRIKLLIVTLLSVSALVIGYVGYGHKIERIEIRLQDSVAEDRDRKFSIVENSELPDYQLVLRLQEREIKTKVMHNVSAQEGWVSFDISSPFSMSDLVQISVVNKQLLTNKVLEVMQQPKDRSGDVFEYKYVKRWDFFNF